MKKTVLLIAIAFIGFQSMNAQVIQGTSNVGDGGSGDATGDMMFGVKAGFGVSTFFGSGFVNTTARPSFYVGGIAEIPAFFDGFYFQPEVLFSLQGADLVVDNLNLIYLHLPLMAKYHIIDEIAVEFGPQVGFLLSDNWEDTLNNTNTLNLSLNIGAGYRMNENFYFQLRFSPGLTKVIENTNLTNGVFQVGAAYFF